MLKNNYEEFLCSLEYSGTYVRRSTESLEASFWKDEYKIALTIRCRDDSLTPLEKYRTFLKVLRFAETEAGKWLAEHSWEYGFILRYPLGKEEITGIQFEPWHFRYVGVDAAEVITKQNITLEEFVENL